jgi:hypothetical protein
MKCGKEYREWKARVNVRDNYICQECGKKGCEAHHIKSWYEFPELRFDVNNGITLCLDCHKTSKHGGRPKIKDGKVVTFYLSFEVIEKISDNAFKTKKSKSQYIEDLVKEMG